jgi:hypothetical protein
MDRLHAVPRKYVVRQSDAEDLPSVDESVALIQNFGLRVQKLIADEKSLQANLDLPTLSSIQPSHRHELAALNSFLSAAQRRYADFLESSAGQLVGFSASLVSLLSSNAGLNVRASDFISDMQFAPETNSRVIKLRFMREALRNKVSHLASHCPTPDYLTIARDLFTAAFFRADAECHWVRKTSFDHYFPWYVEVSAFRAMIEPTVAAAAAGNVMAAQQLISTLAHYVSDEVSRRRSRGMFSVCHCAVVRFCFNEAYSRQ